MKNKESYCDKMYYNKEKIKIVICEICSKTIYLDEKKFKQLLDVLEEFIDLATFTSSDGKNILKRKISEAKNFKELIDIFKNTELTYNEKEMELTKKIYLKALDNNSNYAEKTKIALSKIIKSSSTLQEMAQKVLSYLCTNGISV